MLEDVRSMFKQWFPANFSLYQSIDSRLLVFPRSQVSPLSQNGAKLRPYSSPLAAQLRVRHGISSMDMDETWMPTKIDRFLCDRLPFDGKTISDPPSRKTHMSFKHHYIIITLGTNNTNAICCRCILKLPHPWHVHEILSISNGY